MKKLYKRDDYQRTSGSYAPPLPNGTLSDSARIIHSGFFRLLDQKTQLFPVSQHAVTRNRLTHTLEVTEIAVRIASKINARYDYFKDNPINIGLINAAALAHDIGHPPFGHSGEMQLSKLLRGRGGFESNAQNLRVLTKLEERFIQTEEETESDDLYSSQHGLNLTYRALAGVLKYDRPIEVTDAQYKQLDPNLQELYELGSIEKQTTDINGHIRKTTSDFWHTKKGYYIEDQALVNGIKRKVGADSSIPLYTIECAIMDIADDIAYSTYDFEDAMLVGLFHPFDIVAIPNDRLAELVLKDLNDELKKYGYTEKLRFNDLEKILFGISGDVAAYLKYGYNFEKNKDRVRFVSNTYLASLKIRQDRRFRRRFSEDLIQKAVEAIRVGEPGEYPASTPVWMDEHKWLEIIVLKSLNYHRVIRSPELKVYNKQANTVIDVVFNAIMDGLLDGAIPKYYRTGLTEEYSDEDLRYRKAADLICSLSETDVIRIYKALQNGEVQKIDGGMLLW